MSPCCESEDGLVQGLVHWGCGEAGVVAAFWVADELSGRGSAWGPEICIVADMGWEAV